MNRPAEAADASTPARSWTTRRDEKNRRLAAIAPWLEDGVLPTNRIIDALEIELDPGKRKVLWAEAQQLYATDLPSLPLYFRSDAFILPKWLTGLRPTGNQAPSTLWVTDWVERQ